MRLTNSNLIRSDIQGVARVFFCLFNIQADATRNLHMTKLFKKFGPMSTKTFIFRVRIENLKLATRIFPILLLLKRNKCVLKFSPSRTHQALALGSMLPIQL